jgi:hypothetical protein
MGQGQASHPDNVDIGLFAPGAHGSNASLGAYVEVALRIKPGGQGYDPLPVAADYTVYLVAPKTDFSIGDVVIVSEVNSAIYLTGSTGVMIDLGVLDIGAFDPNNLYFPIGLNSAGMNLNVLDSVNNSWSFSFSFRFNNPKTPAAYNKLRIVDRSGTLNDALSTFAGGDVFTTLQLDGGNQLTPSALFVLPVSMINFSGYKSGTKNVLKWTTANEQNNQGFEVQRSGDGMNYSAVGFVNSIAAGGNSSTELTYSFDDNNPLASKKNYYRLRQVDLDNRSKLSNVVMISSDKPKIAGIGGIFPNPASQLVNVIVEAPQREDVTLVVMDVSGKMVKQKLVNVETGSNTVPIEIGSLASGSYLVKVVSRLPEGESAVSKFVKQ